MTDFINEYCMHTATCGELRREDIDRERAKSALERAEAKLADASLSKEEHRLAESAKRRAQVRLSIPQA